MTQVFVSYSHKDDRAVLPIIEAIGLRWTPDMRQPEPLLKV